MNEPEYNFNGFEFLNRLEKLWNKKEKLKPENSRKKYSQSRLSEYIGISESQISKWQKKSNYPTINTLIKIQKAFGCSLEYLVFGDNNETSKTVYITDILELLFNYDINYNNLEFSIDTEDDDSIYSVIKIKDGSSIKYSTIISEYNRIKQTFDILKEEEKHELINRIIKEQEFNDSLEVYFLKEEQEGNTDYL